MTISKDIRGYMRQIASLVVLSVLIIAAQAFSATFTEPTVAPPNGNVEPPINTSSAAQTKKGALVVNQAAGAAIGLFVPSGRIEIGDRAGAIVPGSIGLGIFGKKIRLSDGTEGDGKILVSNDNGVASWQGGKCDGIKRCTDLPSGHVMIWGNLGANCVSCTPFTSTYQSTSYFYHEAEIPTTIIFSPDNGSGTSIDLNGLSLPGEGPYTDFINCMPMTIIQGSSSTNKIRWYTKGSCEDYTYSYMWVGVPQ